MLCTSIHGVRVALQTGLFSGAKLYSSLASKTFSEVTDEAWNHLSMITPEDIMSTWISHPEWHDLPPIRDWILRNNFQLAHPDSIPEHLYFSISQWKDLEERSRTEINHHFPGLPPRSMDEYQCALHPSMYWELQGKPTSAIRSIIMDPTNHHRLFPSNSKVTLISNVDDAIAASENRDAEEFRQQMQQIHSKFHHGYEFAFQRDYFDGHMEYISTEAIEEIKIPDVSDALSDITALEKEHEGEILNLIVRLTSDSHNAGTIPTISKRNPLWLHYLQVNDHLDWRYNLGRDPEYFDSSRITISDQACKIDAKFEDAVMSLLTSVPYEVQVGLINSRLSWLTCLPKMADLVRRSNAYSSKMYKLHWKLFDY